MYVNVLTHEIVDRIENYSGEGLLKVCVCVCVCVCLSGDVDDGLDP